MIEPTNDPAKALTLSIGSEHLTDEFKTVGDAIADAIATILHGVPILGIVVGGARVANDIRKELEYRRIVRFLRPIAETTEAQRQAFVADLERNGRYAAFGENMLLLLDRLDDISKPTIVGKIMAAHIKGLIDYDKAMRLNAIVSRCYAADLGYLKTFKRGTQGKLEDVADMLYSAGLLASVGIDGGTFAETRQEDGGTILTSMNTVACFCVTRCDETLKREACSSFEANPCGDGAPDSIRTCGSTFGGQRSI